MCSCGSAESKQAHWSPLDILVDAGVASRLPAMVASLRAAGHRVRVGTTVAHAGALGEDDLPDLVVAEAVGVGGVTGLAGREIPVFPPDRVQAALEDGRVGDLLGPFDLGRIA